MLRLLNMRLTDACRSYELSWAIREASERSRDDRLEALELAEPKANGKVNGVH